MQSKPTIRRYERRALYETMRDEATARERIDGFGEPFDLIFYRQSPVDD